MKSVHMNFILMSVSENQEKKHIIVFINDYTWYLWVNVIKYKNDFNSLIQQFFMQYNKKCKCCCLHTDQSDKFAFNAFSNWAVNWDMIIKCIFTVQYQLNSLIKNFNDVLINKISLMLLNVKIDFKYWSEMTQTVNYICNQSFHIKLLITLFEIYHQQKSDLNHFWIIEKECYALKSQHQKLSNKTHLCKFIDYQDLSIFILCLLRNDDLVFIINNVIFINKW